MSDVVISVEGLGKKYRLGASSGSRYQYKSARDSLAAAASAPLRKVRQMAGRVHEGERGHRPEFWALKDVGFEVQQGEVLGIIGRNGAGKSTLLKILSQITEPTEGEVKIKGRVASLLEVGTGFHPELTGRENVYLNGAILGMCKGEIKRKFDEIVAFAEVEKFVDTPVKHYSSGMYLRLAFSVAAHLDPEILVVDEVLAVGDSEFQNRCLGKMGEVAGEGRTVLFVSHNMGAVEQMCTGVMLLEQGRATLRGTDVRYVTRRYLAPTDESRASEWTNVDGLYVNPWFHPHRLAVVDGNGTPCSMPVRNDAELWVEVRGVVAYLDPALTIGYAIFSESGELLYWTYQTDGPPTSWPRLTTGTNLLRSRLPPRLLNEGVYRIELIGGLHNREWLFEPQLSAPSITLAIEGGLSDSPHWTAKRPGTLAPILAWELVQ